MTQYENILVERRDAVLWLRINRPAKRNALSRATLRELAGACASNFSDPTLKAAVLTGEGVEAFAAGGDLPELSQIRTVEQTSDLFDMASSALDEIRRFPVPTVAALNGLAVGGGAELALACDYRLAAIHSRIGFIQARLNISSGFGGGTQLMQLLGYSRGLLVALTAKELDAEEAQQIGLVDGVAQMGESLEACVSRFLEPILAQKPQVIRAYKAMALAERQGFPLDSRREIERDWFARTWTHPDHWTALDLFARKKQMRAT